MKFNDAWYIDNINNVNRAAKEIFKIVFLKLNITTENDNAILMNIGKTSKRYIAFSIKNGLDKIPRGTNSPINLLSVDINILLKKYRQTDITNTDNIAGNGNKSVMCMLKFNAIINISAKGLPSLAHPVYPHIALP